MISLLGSPDRTGQADRPTVAAAVLRVALLGLSGLLVAFAGSERVRSAVALGVVALAALAATLAGRTGWWRLAITVELGVAALAVPLTGGSQSPLLPYLLAPAFAVGFRAGWQLVVGAAAFVVALLFGGLLLRPGDEPARVYAVTVAEWGVLALALGLIAAWARALLEGPGTRERYAEAYRLLSELRGVARRLPGSLDPVSAANALLDACSEIDGVRRGAVLVPTSTDRLAPLVVRGAERLDLDLATAGHGPVALAWQHGVVVREGGRDVRSGMAALLVVPLPPAGRSSGLVVLESEDPEAFPQQVIEPVTRAVRELAPRLESAMVFDEIRTFATVEERQRLAREIHDGIAQELVYVGYELDNLGAEVTAGRPEASESVKRVRQQLTRIISELRLSIFNLRSTVDPGSGLGAALTEYVRSVGTNAGLTVHLSLAEGGGRLPADAETELLRIAQEAIGNARKHARAANLWVSLLVDPPRARLCVEDDGEGFGDSVGGDRFGLEIMRERADRLGARLAVDPRSPRGTRVEVWLGS